jgi:serine/threonine protein kinase
VLKYLLSGTDEFEASQASNDKESATTDNEQTSSRHSDRDASSSRSKATAEKQERPLDYFAVHTDDQLFTYDEILCYALAIAKGMDYLHGISLLYRDLKVYRAPYARTRALAHACARHDTNGAPCLPSSRRMYLLLMALMAGQTTLLSAISIPLLHSILLSHQLNLLALLGLRYNNKLALCSASQYLGCSCWRD